MTKTETINDETEGDLDGPLALPDVAPHPDIVRLDALATRVAAPLNEGQMVWRKWGAGPAVVLLHGGSGSWTHWVRNVEPLSKHFTVWAADLPGHGDSDPLTGDELTLRDGEETDFIKPLKAEWQPVPPPLPAMGRAVASAIERLIPDQMIHLVGFSFGAMVSSAVAPLIPHRIRNIVVAGGGGLAPRDKTMKPMRTWRFETDPERLLEIQRQNILALMLYRRESVDDLALNVHILNTRRTQARKPLRHLSTLAGLARAGRPVSAIWGRHDAISGWKIDDIRQSFRDLDPTSEFHIIEGAGHWVAYEGAEAFNRELVRMLLGQSRPGA